MPRRPARADEPDALDIVQWVAEGSRELIGQPFRLLRSEVRHKLHRAEGAAPAMGAGSALVATRGVLCAHMLVHGLHRATRWLPWGCYGLAR